MLDDGGGERRAALLGAKGMAFVGHFERNVKPSRLEKSGEVWQSSANSPSGNEPCVRCEMFGRCYTPREEQFPLRRRVVEMVAGLV